ncbi:MAG: DNA topoisomerase VI subunit B [Planctomycetes bacterium]|nr:DNA topoisomerase VI subunit B [Planctomycetota bacterium]
MAGHQREISVSEFFTKNRHLLGFDNKRKGLLTTVKEAVDNSLDACEEGGFLPELVIRVEQLGEERFRVTVRDNGPGIVKQQIPNIFGKLLYGSKFHRLKMARGQQGIGISAAGMYGLITTGKPISIVSRTSNRRPAHHYKIAIDTKKNRPDIIHDETVDVDWAHGTEVQIELVASYAKGRQSVDEYVDQTGIANPHASITYTNPTGLTVQYPRSCDELPPPTREIKPHPHGIELGILMKMLKETHTSKVGAFLQKEFSRISSPIAKRICASAKMTTQTWIKQLTPQNVEALYRAMQDTRVMAPRTDCLAPIGGEAILSGLLKGIEAEFYAATTRSPAVYRGNPFQIEVGLAYGGELGTDRHDDPEENGRGHGGATRTRVLRFANRVPLLYQQSACCMFKSVLETKWNNYGLSQARGALPDAPLVILIHIASVWVPFTSESKEAIADYDEITKEIKLALAECGRKLGILLRRKKRKTEHGRRRDVFTRYIDEVVESVRAIKRIDKDSFRRSLLSLARTYTTQADMEFDDHGKVIQGKQAGRPEPEVPGTIVVERDLAGDAEAPPQLFPSAPRSKKRSKGAVSKKRKASRRGKR